MVKIAKIVVCGASQVGKTAIIEHLIYGNHVIGPREFDVIPTIEDTYSALIDSDRGTKEKTRIYDIGGHNRFIERHFINCADAIILVYDVSNAESLSYAQGLKIEIDKSKEKRDILFVLCGNKNDKIKDEKIDSKDIAQWILRDKSTLFYFIYVIFIYLLLFKCFCLIVNHFELNVKDRLALANMFCWIVSRIVQPSKTLLYYTSEV
ncbi:unnamed protein product [Protopolystoma xenopodis]|uniref:Uncharacterized protein n=1 Tax=Protopolystoma xenopodis TaxID=117903 RepID=A0A448X5V6_9PLAT|nr:unnamed protein product [Protopolystoma xenopodis]